MIAAVFLLAGMSLFCASPARAWNCTVPGQIRVQVPNGTVGNGAGDGNGQVVTVEGIAFECEPLPTAGNSNATNTNSNTANGGAGGNATATGGNQKQAQSQNQTLSNSGNSSATGNGVGNGNNSNDSSTVINEPRQVSSAIAGTVLPTVSCFKGVGVGAQTGFFGASFAGGKIDTNCAELEVSRLAPSLLARCKVFITNKYAKQAGVTLDDCTGVSADSAAIHETAPETTRESSHESSPSITVNVPEPVVNVPAPVVNVPAPVVNVPAPVVNVPAPVVISVPAPSAYILGTPPAAVVAASKKTHRVRRPSCAPIPKITNKGCTITNDSLTKH